MKTRLSLRSVFGILPSIAILVLIGMPVYGQWAKVPAGTVPRGPDGKPNLSAPAPRSPDGHPDLSGIWESGGAKYILDLAADLKPGDVPFQPWAKALVDQRADGSHGKWDGDTLVVDTRGFNGKTWLDQTGKPTSDALHVTERFRRKDFGHMDIQVTIDDPKVYTKPWMVTEQVRFVPNTDVIENACENNLDLHHLGGKFSR